MNREKLFNSFSYALWDTPQVTTRIILSTAELIWALSIFLFDRVAYHAQINNTDYTFAGNIVGFLFLISAIIHAGILYNGCHHTIFSRIFSFFNALLWGFVVVMIALFSIPPILHISTISGDIALAISSFWIFIRPYILYEGYKRAAR